MTKNLWWLSFVHNNRPPGDRFVGAAIVRADDFSEAIDRAWVLLINPGGEVGGNQIPDRYVDRVPPEWIERLELITKAECEALDRKFATN